MAVILAVLLTVSIPSLVCAYENSDTEDFRGVWVSTVLNLDYPSSPTTDPTKLKAEIDKTVERFAKLGFNTIILQVAPCSDAIYKSDILPWSSFLTGRQGLGPADGFDPLEYWVKKCHECSMDIHAWINPYRITKGSCTYDKLAKNHPAVLHPSWIVKYSDNNYYYNPGLPEVRDHICSIVRELVSNYDIDGIHMDDYFYPGRDFNDEEQYLRYNNGQFSNIGDWRRNNVNMMVKRVYDTVHSIRDDVVFGISPAGIWDNKSTNPRGSDTNGGSSYSTQYADSLKWVEEEWIDYIIPQIYWEFGAKISDFKILNDWWSDAVAGTDVKLYIGMADYRTYEAGVDSVWYKGKEIKKQMLYNKSQPNVAGEAHFRAGLIDLCPDLCGIIYEQYLRDVTVKLNNKLIEFDQKPVIVNDRTLVPMRKVFEAYGFSVDWDSKLRMVTAVRGSDVVKMTIGTSYFTLNNVKYYTDVPVCIMGDRTMLPLRALSESLRCNVEWNPYLRQVIIEM